MTVNTLTARQAEIHALMEAFQGAHHGIPPTLRYLCKRTGITSTNAMTDHFRLMERKGMLVKVDRGDGDEGRPIYVAVKAGEARPESSKPLTLSPAVVPGGPVLPVAALSHECAKCPHPRSFHTLKGQGCNIRSCNCGGFTPEAQKPWGAKG